MIYDSTTVQVYAEERDREKFMFYVNYRKQLHVYTLFRGAATLRDC